MFPFLRFFIGRSQKTVSKGPDAVSEAFVNISVDDVARDSIIPIPSAPVSAPFVIDGARYLATGYPQSRSLQQEHSISLTTVIWLHGEQCVSSEFLSKIIPELEASDDVFKPPFLQGVVFVAAAIKDPRAKVVTNDAVEYLQKYGNQWYEVVRSSGEQEIPAAGVYIAYRRALFQVYRVYDDDKCAFMTTTLPTLDGSHIPLTTAAEAPGVGQVAVPSRMSTTRTDLLKGLRIAVKDNFHLKGIRASLCNRAYYHTYQEQSQTAACISKLESAGAHVVGTTKLAAFAATEEPIECIDYPAPWNPRGDGYQSPAGSSSGSGVAAASYEWLDVAIGSDTSGSGRRPAHWNGCFAIRPTHGALDIRGFVPSFPQFDTPTIFTRDVYTCRNFAAAWYGDRLTNGKAGRPVTLLVPQDYLQLITNQDQRKLIDSFVSDLEASLHVTRRAISLEESWNASPPPQANGESFQTYMHKVARNSFFYDDYHNLSQFRKDHAEKFSKSPAISPPVRWQWELSATITRAQRDDAIERLVVYKKWFADVIMDVKHKQTIMVIPIENISPRYRDDAKTSFDPEGVPMLFLSPILGGPECTVPIGHVPYRSKMSGCDEFLPVGISLLSAPGSDLALLDMAAACLQQSNRPTSVGTGARMWP